MEVLKCVCQPISDYDAIRNKMGMFPDASAPMEAAPFGSGVQNKRYSGQRDQLQHQKAGTMEWISLKSDASIFQLVFPQ